MPLLWFSIAPVDSGRSKFRAFKRFLYTKRYAISVSLVFYAVVSTFVTAYGWDVVSCLNLLTPVPAATSFGVGLGVSGGVMLKSSQAVKAAMKMDGE